MVGSKRVRQLMMNTAAIARLREHPELLTSPEIRQCLDATRRNISGPAYHRVLDEWYELADSADIDQLAAAVLADNEHGRLLRVMSPLVFVLPEEERRSIYARAAGLPA